MKNSFVLLLFLFGIITFFSCSKDNPQLIFKMRFDSTQVRLNNIGQPATVPAGHAAQTPDMQKMAIHYIELAPDAFTPLGNGAVLFETPSTTEGGNKAIDFDELKLTGNNEIIVSIPLSEVTPGTYTWLRTSLAFQQFLVNFRVNDIPNPGDQYDLSATVASFLGYNQYISTYTINQIPFTVNANRLQGFWAFEGNYPFIGAQLDSGQAPPGATTVPNPLFNSSPIPQGSCIVTGEITNGPLTITGEETQDITVVLSFSTNKSFEWTETAGNGIYEPLNGDTVIDMGIRGLVTSIE